MRKEEGGGEEQDGEEGKEEPTGGVGRTSIVCSFPCTVHGERLLEHQFLGWEHQGRMTSQLLPLPAGAVEVSLVL